MKSYKQKILGFLMIPILVLPYSWSGTLLFARADSDNNREHEEERLSRQSNVNIDMLTQNFMAAITTALQSYKSAIDSAIQKLRTAVNNSGGSENTTKESRKVFKKEVKEARENYRDKVNSAQKEFERGLKDFERNFDGDVTPPPPPPVNQPPVANAQSATTTEDVAKIITLTGSDPEGTALTYSVVTMPAHGTLTGVAPILTYTPALNFTGSDSFTFRVNDGSLTSATATVSIVVTGVNDPPVANAQSATTTKNTAKALVLTGSDPEGSVLTYMIVSGPAHGLLTGALPNVTYTPVTGFEGSDSFTFKVSDGSLESATTTVSLTVQ